MRNAYSQQPIKSSSCLCLYWEIISCSDFLKIGSLAFTDLMHIYRIKLNNFTPVTWHRIHTNDKILLTAKFLATLKMSLCSLLSTPFRGMSILSSDTQKGFLHFSASNISSLNFLLCIAIMLLYVYILPEENILVLKIMEFYHPCQIMNLSHLQENEWKRRSLC